MNDKSEGCVEEKKALSRWKKITIICGTIIALATVVKLWYEVDSWNIRTYGDTVFAKDADLMPFKKIRKVERKIKKKTERMEHLRQRKKDDLLWLSRVKDQYPDVSLMPTKLKKEYDETKAMQEKLANKIKEAEEKLEKWQEELDDLELELDNGGKTE
jgi:septin family protein